MKKQILYILFTLLTFQGGAQSLTPEFEFQLYFEDAAGNKDTITLGYDSNATDSIDTIFGEVDISNIPWKSTGMEVRITNENDYTNIQTYHTKKQIIKYDTCNHYNLQQIDIFTKNWPVNMRWEQLNTDSCARGSIITSYQPGGWFDVGGASNLGIVQLFDSISGMRSTYFSTNAYYTIQNQNYAYLNSNGDTISKFWQRYMDKNLLSMMESAALSEYDAVLSDIIVYPNPFINEFEIKNEIPIDGVKLYGLNGKEQALEKIGNKYHTINCESGIYFLEIKVKNNGHRIFKIIKQ